MDSKYKSELSFKTTVKLIPLICDCLTEVLISNLKLYTLIIFFATIHQLINWKNLLVNIRGKTATCVSWKYANDWCSYLLKNLSQLTTWQYRHKHSGGVINIIVRLISVSALRALAVGAWGRGCEGWWR